MKCSVPSHPQLARLYGLSLKGEWEAIYYFFWLYTTSLLQQELEEKGIRLLIVTGDLIEGTITPKLLERTAPGLIAETRSRMGKLPTAAEMGELITVSAADSNHLSGATIIIGRPLDTLLSRS